MLKIREEFKQEKITQIAIDLAETMQGTISQACEGDSIGD
jgi:hypothetical protein